jgi:23S rRNA pseudouridine2605 synthase
MTIDKKERIAKVIAAAGVCSRRDAERAIEDGRVMVNGKKLTTPAFTVSDTDEITVDGYPLPNKKSTKLWLYHKPAGLVTTAHDPEGRETVFDALPRHLGRVISVGRLDLNSEGLLLLTNDGALSRHLELPSSGLPREYRVRVYGDLNYDDFEELAKGVTIDGVQYRGIHVDVEKEDRSGDHPHGNHWLRVLLHEGKNREIRRVMQAMGLHVNRLIRLSYGPFELGRLAVGKVVEVNPRILAAFCGEIGFKG